MSERLVRCSSNEAAACETALRIARHFEARPGALVAPAAGFTPLAAYGKLALMAKKGEADPASMRYIGLDACGVPPERIRAFDGLAEDPAQEARAMDAYLASAGGLSLAVLGIGLNGHVGFNEPGRPLPGLFSLTELSETTVSAGRKYFGGRPVPTRGATVTLAALMAAEEVLLVATGAHKREIVRAVLAGADVPAAKFLAHPNAVYIFDAEAYPAE